ncbi:MAG: type II secretion system protein [Patescibacteria group bacterium]|nr:type II secretion system protein [Patescibacteria group bacterium]
MKRNQTQLKRKGFTLIELLVVIAIIGILATLAVVALQNARKNARDAKRIADVRQMQTALELYFNDWQEYPTTTTVDAGAISSGTSVYMAVVPTAPTPADDPCETASNTYTYSQTSSGASYTIGFCLGGPTGGMTAGEKCATPAGMLSESCD